MPSRVCTIRTAGIFGALLGVLLCGTSRDALSATSAGCTAWNAVGTITVPTTGVGVNPFPKVFTNFAAGDVLVISLITPAPTGGVGFGIYYSNNPSPVSYSGNPNTTPTISYTITTATAAGP